MKTIFLLIFVVFLAVPLFAYEEYSPTTPIIIAGPLFYNEGYFCQKESGFILGHVRIGSFGWFPQIVFFKEGMDASKIRSYLGQDVFIRGRPVIVPIHCPEPMQIASIEGIVAESIIPVENKKQDIFKDIKYPDTLNGDKETIIRLAVKNPFPCDLEEVRLIIDLDGNFQFKGGKLAEATAYSKEYNDKFKGFEEKEFSFELVPAEVHRNYKTFEMSVFFLGYGQEHDSLKPVYAFWKKRWDNLHIIESTVFIERLIAALNAALKDNDPGISARSNAIEALGNIKDPRAVEPLIAALKDTRWDVRYYVATALGNIKDPRAVEALIAVLQLALQDNDSTLRAQAENSLVQLTGHDFGDNISEWQKWWRENKEQFK